MTDPQRPWKDGPIPPTDQVLETAHVNTDDGYPTIGMLAEEILRLRTVIRSVYICATTDEDATDFILGTTDTLRHEIGSWGEDPDGPVREIERLAEQAEDQRQEEQERRQLAELKAKYESPLAGIDLARAREVWNRGDQGLAYGYVCLAPRRIGNVRTGFHSGCGSCEKCVAFRDLMTQDKTGA